MPWDINQINQAFMANLPNVGEAFQEGRDEAQQRRSISSVNDYLASTLTRGGAGGNGIVATPEQEQESQLLWERLVKSNPQAAMQIRQQQIAQTRQEQKSALIADAIRDPSAAKFANLQAMFPEDREAFQQAWKTRSDDEQKTELRELSSIHGYLSNGYADRAKAVLQRRVDAERKAGNDPTEYEDMIAAIDEDPVRAKGLTQYYLAQIAGPEKFGDAATQIGEEGRKAELQPSAVREAGAKATSAEVEAQYKPQTIESELASEESTRQRNAAQTANEIARLSLDWERLALDKDELATNTQLKLDELQQSGQKIEGASLSALTEAVASAQQGNALASRADSIADRFASLPSGTGGGAFSSLNETLKGSFGLQGGISQLRGEYDQLKNSAALKMLPPGPATDKDVSLAMKGFPPSTADKSYIVSFLRGMAKMQRVAAQADDRKAAWISANGNLGTLRRDANVGGVMVPAGTTFGEFNSNAVKRGDRGKLPERGYLEKWGSYKAPSSLAKR